MDIRKHKAVVLWEVDYHYEDWKIFVTGERNQYQKVLRLRTTSSFVRQ